MTNERQHHVTPNTNRERRTLRKAFVPFEECRHCEMNKHVCGCCRKHGPPTNKRQTKCEKCVEEERILRDQLAWSDSDSTPEDRSYDFTSDFGDVCFPASAFEALHAVIDFARGVYEDDLRDEWLHNRLQDRAQRSLYYDPGFHWSNVTDQERCQRIYEGKSVFVRHNGPHCHCSLKCAITDSFGVRSLVYHHGEMCECFGGGCWDIDQRTGEVGDRRSRIPDYDERRLEYAAEDDEFYNDCLITQNLYRADAKEVRHIAPLTRKEKHGRAEKKRQDEISALQCNCDNLCYDPARDARVRKENQAKKRSPRQREPLKAVVSSLEVEQRAITRPDNYYDKWVDYYYQSADDDDYDYPSPRRPRKGLLVGDRYWAKRGMSYRWYPPWWFGLGSHSRNFKAEQKKAKLAVQTRKARDWHFILVDYFPQFLPFVMHTTLLSSAQYKLSKKSAEVDELLKTQTVRVSDTGYIVKKVDPDKLADLTKSVEYWQWRVEFYEQTLTTRRD